jgi:hypothetical protein
MSPEKKRSPSARAAAGASVKGFAEKQTNAESKPPAAKRQGVLFGWAAGHFAECRKELVQGVICLDEAGLPPGDAMADIVAEALWLEQTVIGLADEFAVSPSTFLSEAEPPADEMPATLHDTSLPEYVEEAAVAWRAERARKRPAEVPAPSWREEPSASTFLSDTGRAA